MTIAYCHICRAEVIDLGGTCKQGHPLAPRPALSAPPPPPPPPPAQASAAPPPPPPRQRAHNVWESLAEAETLANDPIAAFSPGPRMDWGPESEAPIVRSVRSLIGRTRSRRASQSLEGAVG